MSKKVVIIGAGAAGCFLAQRLKELAPDFEVELYEAHDKPLKKVAVTGGGRCNLTNSFAQVTDFSKVYPRGFRLMKNLFYTWNQYDTMSWFEAKGVPLVVQEDECVFPLSQDAMQIVRTLQRGLHIHTHYPITDIRTINADAIVITTGGSRNLQWLQTMGIDTVTPVPSLYPFKLKSTGLEKLMGIVIDKVSLTLTTPHKKYKSNGTLLITHFGVSGPAVLRLSSYAARDLAENNYQASLTINWFYDFTQEDALEWLHQQAKKYPDQQVKTIGSRWILHLLQRASISLDTRWKALNEKQFNRLATIFTADTYDMIGRAPHKDEFVTCGGVSLQAVNATTLESKQHSGLYFAGEILDIDGITGGFNLQAAFTTANTVALALTNDKK